MQFAIGIITHTPLWAWILLAYLVWQGIKAMGPRTTTIWRALIVPAVFIVWGLSRIGLGPQGNVWPLVAWIVAALALMPVGVLTPRPFEVDHATGQIIRPGSVVPLIRNVLVFAVQYTVAVIAAVHTVITAQPRSSPVPCRARWPAISSARPLHCCGSIGASAPRCDAVIVAWRALRLSSAVPAQVSRPRRRGAARSPPRRRVAAPPAC